MVDCPSCSAEVAADTRWCGICHTNVVNQGVGRLASPGKRLGAYFLDLLVLLLVLIVVLVVVEAGFRSETAQGADLFLGASLSTAYLIWASVLFVRGTTPGKAVLGMRVVKEDGSTAGFFTMLIREVVGKTISGLLFSLGFLWILFDRDNQGWHDKLVRTYVVQ